MCEVVKIKFGLQMKHTKWLQFELFKIGYLFLLFLYCTYNPVNGTNEIQQWKLIKLYFAFSACLYQPTMHD